MLPFLWENSISEARVCGPDGIQRGDIVVLRGSSGDYLCHRLLRKKISVDGICLFTKGDARFRPDPPAPADLLIGKIIFVNFGRYKIYIDNVIFRSLGLLIAIFAPVFIRPFQR